MWRAVFSRPPESVGAVGGRLGGVEKSDLVKKIWAGGGTRSIFRSGAGGGGDIKYVFLAPTGVSEGRGGPSQRGENRTWSNSFCADREGAFVP